MPKNVLTVHADLHLERYDSLLYSEMISFEDNKCWHIIGKGPDNYETGISIRAKSPAQLERLAADLDREARAWRETYVELGDDD